MAYLTKDELSNIIDDFALDAIVADKVGIVEEAIEAAIEEVSSRLTPNDKKEWLDGRPLYNVDAIFNATGTERNALMLQNTKIVAGWQIVLKGNAGLDYEKLKSAYDRATKYLIQLATGEVNSRTLPRVAPATDEAAAAKQWRYGSRRKFSHDLN
jgi:hypothetical protein